MKVIAIGAQKGGVGKTTTALYMAAHAAGCLAAGKARVALLDRDESRNLTQLLRLRPDLLAPGVELLPGTAVPPPNSRYDLVVIDTPPGVSAISSLAEANLVLVPVFPEPQGVANLVDYLNNIDNQARSVSPDMRLLALLPTLVDTRMDLHREHIALINQIAALRRPPLAVLPHVRRLSRIARYDLSAPDYATAAKELFAHAFSYQDVLSSIA